MFFLLVTNLGHEHERLTNAWHKKEYQTISGSQKKSKAIIHSLHLPGWKYWNCNLLCKEQTNANLQFETAVCSVRSRQMLICWLNSVSLALSSWIKKIMESGVCVVIMSGVSFSPLKLRWPRKKERKRSLLLKRNTSRNKTSGLTISYIYLCILYIQD